jgi:hypothetical protein
VIQLELGIELYNHRGWVVRAWPCHGRGPKRVACFYRTGAMVPINPLPTDSWARDARRMIHNLDCVCRSAEQHDSAIRATLAG